MAPKWTEASKRTKPSWVARAQKPRTAVVCNGLVGATRPWAKRGLKVQLQRWQLPAWWVALCVAAATCVEKAPLVVGMEIFSGKGELTRAFNDYSGEFLSFELADDEQQNALDLSRTID